MADLRQWWIVREVIEDKPERFDASYTVRPASGCGPLSMTDAAERLADRVDADDYGDPTEREPNSSRLVEVKDGDKWHRFRVRCQIVAQYQATEV